MQQRIAPRDGDSTIEHFRSTQIGLSYIPLHPEEVIAWQAKALDESRLVAVGRRRKTSQHTVRRGSSTPGLFIKYACLAIAVQRRRALQGLIKTCHRTGWLGETGNAAHFGPETAPHRGHLEQGARWHSRANESQEAC